MSQAGRTFVVVGNGMVGQKFLEEFSQENMAQDHLVVICGENHPAYDRVQLSSYFSGKSPDDLRLAPDSFYQQDHISLHLNKTVTSIHRDRSIVRLNDGSSVPYDKLVLATGSSPFIPPIEGYQLDGCFPYRTIDDLTSIQSYAQSKATGVVIGGGLLGLEGAKALKDLGLETQVIEFAPHLMAAQLDQEGGRLLQRKIEALGIKVHTGRSTQKIESHSGMLRLTFQDHPAINTEMVIFSTGIRPNDQLARQAGLAIGPRGGIIINEHCQTSDPHIFAIGECASWSGTFYGLVGPGYQMARTLVSFLKGSPEPFKGADTSSKLKLLGVEVASIGDAHGTSRDSTSMSFYDGIRDSYQKVVMSKSRKNVLGAILVGDTSNYTLFHQMMKNKTPLPSDHDSLLLSKGGERGTQSSPMVSDDSIICSCNNVSKKQLSDCIIKGSHSINHLKETSRAGTSCGGCLPFVQEILEADLAKHGVKVDRNLCEHFHFTRQELYHLVQVNKIKSFQVMLEKFGKGLGCHICKTTMASILASCWNHHILSEEHSTLQDTNDAYLGNIQKNGTYSVVPRIPGGEILPTKLIEVGRIAVKYNLYTKITGGQRIDLLGARLEQLPDIWKDLIEAGFESGHAYGKAVRTVKSCVGDTWCRYGVNDSLTAAIDLEKRYRGIRAPHKLKMAVSGCTRECAEAKSKDVGVIATEKGWNLYVGGNGGSKPRHADLLAADLDDDSLVKFIDRFLMFYIRTGDRLQRTSTWLDQIEGGIDYVRKVVMEDSLNIGEQLEQDMQALVDTYQCEWKTTIEDPIKLKRFKSFINTKEADRQIAFTTNRGQIKPVRPMEA